MAKAEWQVSAGATICPQCGGESVSVDVPSRLERLLHWLRFGSRLGPRLTCDVGHRWSGGSTSQMTLRRSAHPVDRLLRLPRGIIRLLRHGRRVEPTPIIYVVAAGVGVALGVFADIFLDWRWWLVAGSFVVVVWLLYASTAFWGPHRSDLLSVFAPQRASAKAMRDLLESVESGECVVYGVAASGDAREYGAAIGGWGSRNGRRHSVTMRYDRDDGTVEVATSDRSHLDTQIELVREIAADNLVGRTGEPPPRDLSAEEMHNWRVRNRIANEKRLEGIAWVHTKVIIDGDERDADLLNLEQGQAAVAPIGEFVVTILTIGIDVQELSLTQLPSLEPFIDKDARGF